MEDLSIDDMIAVFKRRFAAWLLTFLLVLGLTTAAALHWSRYRATATVQIEQSYIPSSVTRVNGSDQAGSVVGLADRRIRQIEQKVTSIASLGAIIAKLNLYPSISATLPASKLAATMRNNIKLGFISSAISNPAAAQKESIEQLSAIAFTLSFDYHDPALAKEALDAIVQAFIDEEASQRRLQTQETSAFLDTEIATLEESIKAQEAKVAEFRSTYGDSGPSTALFNQQASLTNAMNLQTVESQISAAESNVASLRSQLASAQPYLSTSSDGKTLYPTVSQLEALQVRYESLTTRYGPKHPDVLKVKEEMKALQARKPSAKREGVAPGADNPIYTQLNAQLSAAEAQRRALIGQRAALQQQQAKLNLSIAKNPAIEQQMSQLTLDLDNAKERHRALKDKKFAAQMQAKLESSQNGERLKVIIPATVPDSTNPKRLYLMVAGLVLSLIASFGLVTMLEIFSQSVRGVNHLSAIVGVAPLVSIPTIHMKAEGQHG